MFLRFRENEEKKKREKSKEKLMSERESWLAISREVGPTHLSPLFDL